MQRTGYVLFSALVIGCIKRMWFVYKQSRSRDCGQHVNKHSINSSDIHFHHETSLVALKHLVVFLADSNVTRVLSTLSCNSCSTGARDSW